MFFCLFGSEQICDYRPKLYEMLGGRHQAQNKCVNLSYLYFGLDKKHVQVFCLDHQIYTDHHDHQL